MTCRELSKFCTNYIGALRLARKERAYAGDEGLLNFIMVVIGHQIRLLESDAVSDQDKEAIRKNSGVALMAICMASISAIDSIDPRHAAQVAAMSLEAVAELTNGAGPVGEDDVVVIDVRKHPKAEGEWQDGDIGDDIQIGVHMEPLQILSDQINNTELGKQISRIVREGQ
jgi:hypothetical protein